MFCVVFKPNMPSILCHESSVKVSITVSKAVFAIACTLFPKSAVLMLTF